MQMGGIIGALVLYVKSFDLGFDLLPHTLNK